MRIIVGIIAVIAAVAAVYFISLNSVLPMIGNTKDINLIASDNVKIAANLFEVSRPKGWLILIHMLPATKESWDEFAGEMRSLGYESLAIDLRGHGKSNGGPDGYQKFSDAQHQAGIKDVEAAWEFLKTRGAVPEKTTVIGASIGANLGLQFLTLHRDIGGGVFLSPGDYKGIDSSVLVKKLDANQKLILVASRKDDRTTGNNAEQNQIYYNSAAQVRTRHLIIFDGAGHGTELFGLKEEFNLTEAIKKFLTNGTIN